MGRARNVNNDYLALEYLKVLETIIVSKYEGYANDRL